MTGLRRKRDHRAFGRIHLREANLERAQPPLGKGIIPARIQNHHFEPGMRHLHLPQDRGRIDHLKPDVGFRFGICIDGNQVISPIDLKAVPSIVEQRDIGAACNSTELLRDTVEFILVEIELGFAVDQGKAQATQCPTHQRGVVRRIGQLSNAFVI